MSDQPIVITVTIAPVANGKRKIVLSGAPKGEMPVVRVGVFADIHRLFDETWVELQKRKPQIVKVKSDAKAKGNKGTAGNEGTSGDQSVADGASANDAPAQDELSEDLPVIEGDSSTALRSAQNDADADDADDETEDESNE